MATLHVYAGKWERLEALLFARDPAKAYGPPDELVEKLLNEGVLERGRAALPDLDAEAAEAALRTLILGPRPKRPLDRLHAVVLHALLQVLCSDIGDDAFGPTTLSALAETGQRWGPTLGSAFAEGLTVRRLPLVEFADNVTSPCFSYWRHVEMKQFLERLPEATRKAAGEPETLDMLRRLGETWTDAVGQGPDAILVKLV